MSYSKLRFCGEMFLLIDEGASADQIASWANKIYLTYLGSNEPDVENLLSELSIIDTPGFEIGNSEIISRCIKILEGYL